MMTVKIAAQFEMQKELKDDLDAIDLDVLLAATSAYLRSRCKNAPIRERVHRLVQMIHEEFSLDRIIVER